MSNLDKELFDIYMKLEKEDLVKLLIESRRNQPVLPNQVVYPMICPPQMPDSVPWPPKVWYTTFDMTNDYVNNTYTNA